MTIMTTRNRPNLLTALFAAAVLSACTSTPMRVLPSAPIGYIPPPVGYIPPPPISNTPPSPPAVAMPPNPTPLGLSGPPLPSPPGGGCLPFASLVPPGPNPPDTAKVADVLFRAGYIIARIENGRVEWRCARALASVSAPQLVEPPSSPNPPSAIVPPQEAAPAIQTPQPDARVLIERLLPGGVSDRNGWAADIADAFAALSLPPRPELICGVIGVIGQESGFEADPVIPGLGKIAEQELERRRQKYGVPRVLLDAALAMKSPDGHSYKERIDSVHTERQLSAVYEDFIGGVPLGERLLGRYNPIRTIGPMQVSFEFIAEYARQHPAYALGRGNYLRAVGFSRPGGIYFGAAHLLDYSAPYDSPIYRFADYNAGRYASRNAAFQAAVARLSGIQLALDGVLTRPGDSLTDTARAALALGPRLGLNPDQILRELRLERAEAFENTELYRRVFKLADERAGAPLLRAILPQIKLAGPKIQRNYLTTAWFAERVNSRYRACLARNDAGEKITRR
ncbi:MAG: DUF1615 domain-containing protein [Fimbriimonadaceae bacterium]|nr:DUF1615 domain-containing protein [Fimbriimonadaceae bacterium]